MYLCVFCIILLNSTRYAVAVDETSFLPHLTISLTHIVYVRNSFLIDLLPNLSKVHLHAQQHTGNYEKSSHSKTLTMQEIWIWGKNWSEMIRFSLIIYCQNINRYNTCMHWISRQLFLRLLSRGQIFIDKTVLYVEMYVHLTYYSFKWYYYYQLLNHTHRIVGYHMHPPYSDVHRCFPYLLSQHFLSLIITSLTNNTCLLALR